MTGTNLPTFGKWHFSRDHNSFGRQGVAWGAIFLT
jgi:hypothetical protein